MRMPNEGTWRSALSDQIFLLLQQLIDKGVWPLAAVAIVAIVTITLRGPLGLFLGRLIQWSDRGQVCESHASNATTGGPVGSRCETVGVWCAGGPASTHDRGYSTR